MLGAVIFDFDGVITDSEILHLRAFNKVLIQFGFEIEKKDYYSKYLGYTDADCYAKLIEDGLLKTKREQIPNLITQKNIIFEELAKTEGRTIEGVHEFLSMLSENNIPMAICSGALMAEIELILNEANLRERFVTIVSAEDVTKGKPHPEGFLITLTKLKKVLGDKITAEQCIVIEDSLWGIKADKAARMHCIAVTNSYEAGQLSSADKIVQKLSDLNINELEQLCM